MTEITLEQITAKWTPLMLGVSEEKTPRLAWALEQEAAFLKGLTRETRNEGFGDKLKLLFPAIRRAVEYIDEGEPSFANVYAAVSAAVQEITEAAVQIDPGDSVCVEEQAKFAADLADRLHASLLSVPG